MYAGKALGCGSCVVVAILEAGVVKRVRTFVVGRHDCEYFDATSCVDLAWCLAGRRDANDKVLLNVLGNGDNMVPFW